MSSDFWWECAFKSLLLQKSLLTFIAHLYCTFIAKEMYAQGVSEGYYGITKEVAKKEIERAQALIA